MAQRPKVDHVRTDFINELASAKHLAAAILALPGKVHPNVPIGLHPKHQRLVLELAFMGVVAAWEEFLERILVRYLAGALASSGYSPTPKYGLAKDIQHAYQLLSKDTGYDPVKHYLKASDPKWVWTQADFYFSQHPFRWLQTNVQLLNLATDIRNRVAHDSEKCKSDFKAAAVAFLHPPNGMLVQGFSAGSLLNAQVQRLFPQVVIQHHTTHFDAYLDLFTKGANALVP